MEILPRTAASSRSTHLRLICLSVKRESIVVERALLVAGDRKGLADDLRFKPSSDIADLERKRKASVICLCNPKNQLSTTQGSSTLVACEKLLCGSEDSFAT